jgi:Integrase core domain
VLFEVALSEGGYIDPEPVDQLLEVCQSRPSLPHAWVTEYNTARPHQSCGGRPPAERFRLAAQPVAADTSGAEAVAAAPRSRPAAGSRPAGMSRWVNANGKISLAGFSYHVGATYAGEPVEAVTSGGLVDILHAGVVVATHVQRLRKDQADGRPA